jgi:hypothetical protein
MALTWAAAAEDAPYAEVALDWVVIAAAMAGATLSGHPVGYAAALLVVGNRQHAQGDPLPRGRLRRARLMIRPGPWALPPANRARDALHPRFRTQIEQDAVHAL